MLDGYGGIHPFAIGSAALPPKIIGNPYWNGQDKARGIMLTSDGKGGYVVDSTGKLYPFSVSGGAAPAAANNVAIVSAVSMQGGSFINDNTGGFTVDGWGGAHGFGVEPLRPAGERHLRSLLGRLGHRPGHRALPELIPRIPRSDDRGPGVCPRGLVA